jgi:uncharacterized RDD family membrane protein YckC
MQDKSIEPSEIIIDGKGLPKEKVSRVNPPIRFLARFFDYSIFLLILLIIRYAFDQGIPDTFFEYMIPFEYLAWIPIETALLCTWGSTPGKYLLRMQIKHGRKNRFDSVTALRRSFHVWLRGIGMGIPFVNVLCMLVASSKLRLMGMTTWDREDNITVSHYPVSKERVIAASVITFLGFMAYYARF